MIILSSTAIDLDGESLNIQDLINMRDHINGKTGLKLGLLHNPLYPPLGQLYNARLQENDEGITLLVADEFYFKKEKIEINSEEFIICSHENSKPFSGINHNSKIDSLMLYDYLVFKDNYDKNLFENDLINIHKKLHLGRHVQKAAWNDPQIIITLGQYFFFYKILKPIGEKLISKIAEDLGEEFFQQYLKLKKLIIRSIREFGSKNKPVIVVIQIPSENIEIELVHKVHLNNIDDFLELLHPENLKDISRKSIHYENLFQAEKIQFILTKNNSWDLNYILSKDGKVIGKNKYFKERDVIFSKLSQQNEIGISYGARKIEKKDINK